MIKNRVTIEDVQANMKDVLVRTVNEFGKPVTYVSVRMKNGFTVRESTTCVDPANYNEAIGKRICMDKIADKIWMLLGYELQSKLASGLDDPAKQRNRNHANNGFQVDTIESGDLSKEFQLLLKLLGL